MSILDGLIRGASAGVIGAQKGIAGRRELEQKALHDMLARRLLEAQINQSQANTARLMRPEPEAVPEPYTLSPGARRYNPDGSVQAENPTVERPVTPERVDPLSKLGIERAAEREAALKAAVPPTQARTSPGIVQAVAANRNQLSAISRAMGELGKRPEGVGLKGYIPDFLLQRDIPFVGDPEGVPLRAEIADIGSLIIHDRSGAAVTIAEMEKLKPFIPNDTDTPEAIRYKLQRLQELIEEETRFLSEAPAESEAGTAPPRYVAAPKSAPATPAKTYRPNNPFKRQ